MSDLLDGVTWFRGSSIRILRAGVELYVDPVGVPEDGEADYVLLTHPHYDNFSEEGIARVRGTGTVVVAPATMKKQLEDADHFMRAGDLVSLDGVDILAVPAHNLQKKFHPAESGWLGYVFTLGSVTYYHAGDTDLLASMEDIRCDVAFLPCDARYTMDPSDAARAAEMVGARVVVPIRWGDADGSDDDPKRMDRLFDGDVHLLDRAG